ncbi:MAG: YfhO family protein [Pyrinomonadaceae bacterium]
MNRVGWQERWSRRRADVGALAFIVCFFFLFFSWLGTEHKLSVGSDAFGYSFPLRTVAWAMLRQGAWPLWTPHVLSGYPLLAMTQLALGYPLTWGYLFLPGHYAEEIYLLAPFLLAPAFTYAYARELALSRTAALLAGLTFGYGGIMIGVLGLYGFMSNSILWLPLLLTAIERAQHAERFIPSLLLCAAAFAMSLLNGYAQGAAYTAALAGTYACFISIATPPADHARGWGWPRWRPLLAACGGLLLALGVAAFQLLETMRAVRRSVRTSLGQELFQRGTPQQLNYELGSLLAPRFYWEIPTYVPPLALALAALAAVCLVRRGRRNARVLFWLAVAIVAWPLMLANTPLTQLFNHAPVFRWFQTPLRHAFEWTFAVGILAAYGWDILRARLRTTPARAKQRCRPIIVVILLLISFALAVFWWRAALTVKLPGAYPALADLLKSSYFLLKTSFTLLLLVAIWQGQCIVAARTRRALLLCAIALACFVEPHISVWHWWRQFAKPPARYSTPGAATRFLQQFPPEQNRIYTRVNLFVEEFPLAPRLDPPNVTARYGLYNAAGAEPLILERYSRALGGVGPDAISPRAGGRPDNDLLAAHSHVLDLLNIKFFISFAGLVTAPNLLLVKDDIKYSDNLNLEIAPGATTTLAGLNETGDTLALVTVLSRGSELAQNDLVARVRVYATAGRIIERELRAGRETSEWAHERPDVRPFIRHQLAPVFDEHAGDAAHSFTAYRYLARLPLDATLQVERVEITNVTNGTALDLSAVTLFDSGTHASTPLPQLDAARWQAVYNKDDVLVLRNARALPRAWLVTEADAVDGEEALRRIRGEGAHEFDPQRTALLEVRAEELPPLPGGPPPETAVQVAYRPNSIELETDADRDALLVVSEMTYPGWVAIVDEAPAPLYTTDYILQSVPVPAGRHHVRLRYTAPAARNGALISLATLLLMCALVVYQRRVRASKQRADVFGGPPEDSARASLDDGTL